MADVLLTGADGREYEVAVERTAVAALLVVLVVGAPGHARADDTSMVHVSAAMHVCQAVDYADGDDKLRRLAMLEGGVREGEVAVAADPADARAHLALFCN